MIEYIIGGSVLFFLFLFLIVWIRHRNIHHNNKLKREDKINKVNVEEQIINCEKSAIFIKDIVTENEIEYKWLNGKKVPINRTIESEEELNDEDEDENSNSAFVVVLITIGIFLFIGYFVFSPISKYVNSELNMTENYTDQITTGMNIFSSIMFIGIIIFVIYFAIKLFFRR